MQNEHPVFQLIKTMTISEKAYFKKYSFLYKSDSNTVFKRMFDRLSSQEVYDIDILLKDKKIPNTIKKRIHVSLNNLNKKIVHSLLEYRKGKSDYSNFLHSMEEYELYKEKKLENLAEKKIKKIEQFIVERNLFILKPYFYYTINKSMLNNVAIKNDYRISQNKKFEDSIETIYHKGQLIVTAYKFESLVQKNGSIVFTDKENLKDLAILKQKTLSLIKYFSKDFKSYSSLSNNLLLMNMIENNVQGIKELSIDFLSLCKQKFPSLNDQDKIMTFIFLKNLGYNNLQLQNFEVFENIHYFLKKECKIIENKEILKTLQSIVINLNALYYYLNPNRKVKNTDVENFVQTIQSSDKSKSSFYELLCATSIILVREHKFQESLDLTSNVHISDFNARTYDSYVLLKSVRAICWLKLENIELFNSELTVIYKFLLKNRTVSYAKEIINFIKKLNQLKLMSNKERHLKTLIQRFDGIQENGSFYEKMEARELELLLKLALR